MSVRSFSRCGSAPSVCGVSQFGSSLSILDCTMLGSTFSLRGFSRFGSSLSVYGLSRMSSSMSLLDFVYIGSSMSLRGFLRVGSAISVYGTARFGSSCSVLDYVSIGSSCSCRFFFHEWVLVSPSTAMRGFRLRSAPLTSYTWGLPYHCVDSVMRAMLGAFTGSRGSVPASLCWITLSLAHPAAYEASLEWVRLALPTA